MDGRKDNQLTTWDISDDELMERIGAVKTTCDVCVGEDKECCKCNGYGFLYVLQGVDAVKRMREIEKKWGVKR